MALRMPLDIPQERQRRRQAVGDDDPVTRPTGLSLLDTPLMDAVETWGPRLVDRARTWLAPLRQHLEAVADPTVLAVAAAAYVAWKLSTAVISWTVLAGVVAAAVVVLQRLKRRRQG